MKVYGLPEHLEYKPDFSNYNFEAESKREEEIKVQLKEWLVEQGYTGPHTGEIASFGVADGYASYMFADGGRQSCLIHLPFGDAYQYQDVRFLPKAEVLKRISQRKRLAAMFGQG